MAEFKIPNDQEWLDMVKTEIGLETDAEAAAYLKIPKQVISNWRNNRVQIGVGDAMTVGLAIGVNPLFVILSSQYHTAKPEKREKWRMMASPVEPKTPRKPGKKRLNR